MPQMIDAACVVGARFVQRRFFQHWRERAAQQEAVEKGARKPPVVVTSRSRLRARQLRVVGAAIPRPAAAAATAPVKSIETVGQRNEALTRANALRHLLDMRDQRRLFLCWRSAAAALRLELEQKALVAATVLRFQVRQLLARWKRRAATSRERLQLEQRAHFFLYFCLTKRSLEHLARHAAVSKRSRAAAAIAASGVKRRTLRQMIALSDQRRWLRGVCGAWHVHAAAKKHAPDPAVASAKLLVWSRLHSRLLRKAFVQWREALVRKQVRARLVRVAQQYRVWAMRLAWRRWQQLVARVARVERWHDARNARVQQQIWDAWRQQAIRASKKEQARRRAVRFAYRRSLRKTFDGFFAATQQSRDAAESADSLASARTKRVLTECVGEWIAMTIRRRDTARQQAEADRLYEHVLVSRVWTRGWRSYVASRASKRAKAEHTLQHFHVHLQRAAFDAWRTEWINQRKRRDALEAASARYLAARNQDRTARAFHVWLEHVRRRQAQRIVNAHIRGQWQLKVLRKSFSDWLAGVTEIRWQLIQSHRAQQLHVTKLMQKCFAFWKKKVAARKQFRDQNRAALIHWKLTVERKAFAALKAYVVKKRAQRARMHDALEFRHRLIVRDGVRHWMAAALHLQSQREDLVSQCQADRAARIWRAVARIARHWRSVTISRRPSRNGASLQVGVAMRHIERGGGGGDLDSSWGLHLDHKPQVGRYRSPPIRAAGKENRDDANLLHRADPETRVATTTARSGLSEFVTHPAMHRPQPRRPIDLLLGDAYMVPQQHLRPSSPPDTTKNFAAVANDLHAHYGFTFPAQPFDPLSAAPPPHDMHHEQTALQPRTPSVPVQQDANVGRQPSAPRASPTLLSTPVSTRSQLDTLETQLRRWMTRKQHLKTLHDQIQAYRHQLAVQRCVELRSCWVITRVFTARR